MGTDCELIAGCVGDCPKIVEWLDSEDGEWLLPYLRVARAYGKPPLTVIAGRPEVWRHEEDTALAVALDIYEQTRLDHLGLPKRKTEEGDDEGYWEVEEKFNAAQQAQDIYKAENKDPEAGVVFFLKDTRDDDQSAPELSHS